MDLNYHFHQLLAREVHSNPEMNDMKVKQWFKYCWHQAHGHFDWILGVWPINPVSSYKQSCTVAVFWGVQTNYESIYMCKLESIVCCFKCLLVVCYFKCLLVEDKFQFRRGNEATAVLKYSTIQMFSLNVNGFSGPSNLVFNIRAWAMGMKRPAIN